MEIYDADWSDDIIQELTQQWRKADAIMSRVTAVEAWLERDPANTSRNCSKPRPLARRA